MAHVKGNGKKLSEAKVPDGLGGSEKKINVYCSE